MDVDSRVNMTRLFVDSALMENALIELNSGQSHYLSSVLRKKMGLSFYCLMAGMAGFWVLLKLMASALLLSGASSNFSCKHTHLIYG